LGRERERGWSECAVLGESSSSRLHVSAWLRLKRRKELFADEISTTRIHKRLIDLNAPTEVVKQIIINIEAGVEVEVTIAA